MRMWFGLYCFIYSKFPYVLFQKSLYHGRYDSTRHLFPKDGLLRFHFLSPRLFLNISCFFFSSFLKNKPGFLKSKLLAALPCIYNNEPIILFLNLSLKSQRKIFLIFCAICVVVWFPHQEVNNYCNDTNIYIK